MIRIDLGGTVPSTDEGYLEAVNTTILDSMTPFADILEDGELTRAEKATYSRIASRTASREELKISVRMLCMVVARNLGSKAMILIDDYDSAVTGTRDHGISGFAADFLSGFLSSSLKSNPSLRMGCVMGTANLIASGMLSGPDNLLVNDESGKSDERFGPIDDGAVETLAH